MRRRFAWKRQNITQYWSEIIIRGCPSAHPVIVRTHPRHPGAPGLSGGQPTTVSAQGTFWHSRRRARKRPLRVAKGDRTPQSVLRTHVCGKPRRVVSRTPGGAAGERVEGNRPRSEPRAPGRLLLQHRGAISVASGTCIPSSGSLARASRPGPRILTKHFVPGHPDAASTYAPQTSPSSVLSWLDDTQISQVPIIRRHGPCARIPLLSPPQIFYPFRRPASPASRRAAHRRKATWRGESAASATPSPTPAPSPPPARSSRPGTNR